MITLSQLNGFKRMAPATLQADSEGKVVMTLPEDFLTLLSLRLSSWERPVREVLGPDHWLHRLQATRLQGLRGSPERPLAFFTADDEGRPALELFSSPPDAPDNLVEFIYLPRPLPG